jgi:hypothetical protein
MKMITPVDENIENNFSMTAPSFVDVKLKTDKIALIDADFIKYFVCNDIKKEIDKKVAYIYEDPAIKFTKKRLNKIFNSFDSAGIIFCFSGSSENTFRTGVSFEKKYKGNRTYTPLYEGELADKATCMRYIKERYPTLLYGDLEADDLLCMLQDKETFIYSRDKDLIQVSGTHYDVEKHEFIEVSNEQALKFLMTQMLTGDSVDNISGIKGIGEVKAVELLTNLNAKESVVKVFNQYIIENGYFNGIDMFVESWNLLRLRNNRGTYFKSRYQGAFDVLQMLKLNAVKNV